MNLSRNWLADYVDVNDINAKDYCDRMTDTGSKVEGFEILGDDISNVVVGKINAISNSCGSADRVHADKMKKNCEIEFQVNKTLKLEENEKYIFAALEIKTKEKNRIEIQPLAKDAGGFRVIALRALRFRGVRYFFRNRPPRFA